MKSDGEVLKRTEILDQTDFFALIDDNTNIASEKDVKVKPRYVETKIIDVYLEEMEESSG